MIVYIWLILVSFYLILSHFDDKKRRQIKKQGEKLDDTKH